MPGSSLSTWISEQETKRRPLVFIAEFLFVFALAAVIWTATLSMWEHRQPSMVLVALVSGFYGTAIVYPRLFNATSCQKCHSLLPLLREELDRQHVRDREDCVEVERGGEAWGQYSLQLYQRTLRVDRVRFRCRRCRRTWEQMEESPASDYQLVRTIHVDVDK